MLKKSIIDQRMRELTEAELDSRKYRKLREISHRQYEKILKKYIPEEKQYEIGNALFDYEVTITNAEFEYIKEAYRQGIKDGFELSKIINKRDK